MATYIMHSQSRKSLTLFLAVLFAVFTQFLLTTPAFSQTPRPIVSPNGGVYRNYDFDVTTTAFSPGGSIGKTYAADGKNESPPLTWIYPPPETMTYAVIMEGQDTSSGNSYHWIMYDIPVGKKSLRQDIPHQAKLADGSIQSQNSFKTIGYHGPDPVPGTEPRYYLTFYALDSSSQTAPSFTAPETDMQEFLRYIKLHTLGKCELTCTYSKR